MKEYKVLFAVESKELEKQINSLARKGWIAQGGITISSTHIAISGIKYAHSVLMVRDKQED